MCLLGRTDGHGEPLRTERIADALKAKGLELIREASLRTRTPLQEQPLELTRGLDRDTLRSIVELARKIAQEED